MDEDTNSELGVLPFACLLNQIRQRVHQSPFYKRTPVEPVNTWKRLTKSKLWIIFCLFGWCRIRANLDIKWKNTTITPFVCAESHQIVPKIWGLFFFPMHTKIHVEIPKNGWCAEESWKLMDQLPATENNISSTGSTISVRVKTRWKKKKKKNQKTAEWCIPRNFHGISRLCTSPTLPSAIFSFHSSNVRQLFICIFFTS